MSNPEWEKIYTGESEFEVEILRSMLEGNEIPAMILNKQDSFYKVIGSVELYTQRSFVVKAINLIRQAQKSWDEEN